MMNQKKKQTEAEEEEQDKDEKDENKDEEEEDKGPLSTAEKTETSPSNGPEDAEPSHSNDVPLIVNSPGFATPALTRPHQDPAVLTVEHSWHSNDKN